MAEISHGGLWIRWSSLNKRDKRDFALSMALLFFGGMVLGFLTGRFENALRETTVGLVLLALVPLLPLLIGGYIYLRFVMRQDELFRMFHMITCVWGFAGAMLVVVPGLLLASMAGLGWLGLHHVLLGAGFGSMIGGFWASRRYL